MSRYRQLASLGLCTALLQGVAWAQEDVEKVLIEQGNYWQDRKDPTRAAEAWNKLLLMSPDNPQALYGLAKAELAAKRLDRAKQYLERLRKAHPDSALLTVLDQEITLRSGTNMATLEQARKLAAAGKLDEAVAAYRSVLQGRAPQGDLAREYYTYLGFTTAGLAEAIEGLRRLAQQFPDDMQVAQALAQHLARNESTRAEGIRRLATFASRQDATRESIQSWRTALTWVGPPPAAMQPLFEDYLRRFPDDTVIREQLQQAQRQHASQKQEAARSESVRRRTDHAVDLMDRGDFASAEAELRAVLSERPNDNHALGSLGVLYMRQGKWSQAREALQRARAGSPAWQNALNTVTYWSDVERAETLYAQGKLSEARRILNQAAKSQPKEVAANVLLADILLEEGKTKEALSAYEAVLRRNPGNPGALEGFARVSRQSGDIDTARNALESALGGDPDNPWLRYELARVYQELGRNEEARGLINGMLMTRPDDPQALYVGAMMADQNGEAPRAYEMLNRIPEGQRTAAMKSLLLSTGRKLQIEQAVQWGRQGRKHEAMAMLGQIQAATNANDVETLSAVAQAYVDLGEPGHGLLLLRPLRQQGGARSIDASLAYAQLLLRSDQDVEAAVVMRNLAEQKLTLAQRRSLTDLSDAYRIRQADALRERGDLVAAYDMLAPVLQRKPQDSGAVGALARMYAAAGNGEQALGLYESLLQSDRDNADLRMGAAQAAMQLKNHRYARQEADIAVSLAPDRVDILTAAARVYRDQGKMSQATDLLQRALALEASNGVVQVAGFGAHQSIPSGNPFLGMPGQRSVSGGGAVAAYPVPAAAAVVPPPASIAPLPPGAAYSANAQTGSVGTPYSMAVPSMATSLLPHGGGLANPDIIAPTPPTYTPAVLPVPGSYAVAQAGNYPPAARGAYPYAAMSPVQRELDQIRQERSAEARMGTELRSRNGADGTSKLNEVQVPLQILFPAGDGKIDVRMTPVSLDAGSLSNDPYALATFGGGAPAYAADPSRPEIKSATGVGFSAGYKTENVELDLGVSPVGFQETNFVGGLLLKGTLDEAGTVNYRVDFSRRPVTESLLSYAGMKDERTGQQWGGVTATGVRATVGKDFGDAGIYGDAAWHSLQGNEVASNRRMEFNTGAYFRVIDEVDSKLTAGVNLNATFFDENLSFFTYGHGGYFSPQHSYSLSVPVSWAQRADRMTYRIDGSVGLQHFKQDDAPMFPNNPELQALARPDIPGISDGFYPGQTKTGVSYNVRASAEYRLAPQWAVGAVLGADNASDYRQWAGGLYLRYYFQPQTRELDVPHEPHRSPYGNTYGR